MGNQNAKELEDNGHQNTKRCPQRNRCIQNINPGLHMSNCVSKCQGDTLEKSLKNKTVNNLISRETLNKGFKTQEKQSKKMFRKKLVKKQGPKRNRILKGGPENIPSNVKQENFKTPNVATRKQPCKLRKRHTPNAPSQNEAHLITDILNTVAELESTFLDEKKYERKLSSAFSKQIESIHQLKLSLHIEKERNKRLMDLMNRYDNPECSISKENNSNDFEGSNPKKDVICLDNGLNNGRSFNWSDRHMFSYMADTSISPVLMRQRYEELSKSYSKCQIELQKKEKLLTLAQCKQEALQAKCDRLTEQFLSSQRRIQSLYQRNAALRTKYTKKVLGNCSETNESDSEIEKNTSKIPQPIAESWCNDIKKDRDEKEGYVIGELKDEFDKLVKKAKRE